MSEHPAGTGDLSPLKRALLAVERLRERVSQLEGRTFEPLAIVGIGCRLPGGVHDLTSFLALLHEGRDAILPAPPVPRPGWPDEELVPPGGWLDHDVGAFDPAFFGISPREAASIDPQQRLLLEVAWEAFEDAGIDPASRKGSPTGVFVGVTSFDYVLAQVRSERAHELTHAHFASGVAPSMASGRLAYLLGLRGPALTVDTACSSSLVAVHLAAASLRSRESDLALVGGVNLILTEDFSSGFVKAGMLAPDGRCKTFDSAADGYSRSEGCGMLLLKRLADAERDGDRIHAVIRASAVNQDGASSGLTAPNGPAQEELIRAAIEMAGLTPDDIDYVEAHGTGTPLGDPIEVQALGSVFANRPAERPVLLGSVKTNIGHLEAAAGVAGLIKATLIVREGTVPPHLHLTAPNPHIPWARLRVAVPTQEQPLPTLARPHRAGVSSFGFSGTNAHVIVESPPRPADVTEPARPEQLLVLSAPSTDGLRALTRLHSERLGGLDDELLADYCATACRGRSHFLHRLAVPGSGSRAIAAALDSWASGDEPHKVYEGHLERSDRASVAFLFTGQGAQYKGMGWALQLTSPLFRNALLECDDLLRDHIELSLLDLLDPDGPAADLVDRTDLTQPALFALQYGLTKLWASWGVTPDVVAGHSIGEYAAAYLAGVFGLEDALKLVALRGRLMQRVRSDGAMLAVMAPEDRVSRRIEALAGAVSLAAVNAPDQVVVSGAAAAVSEVAEWAASEGIRTRDLRTSQAFHSHLMDEVAEAFSGALSAVRLAPGRNVRFVSSMTGALVRPDELARPDYWARQLREPVRFADAMSAVRRIAAIGVEIGPDAPLTGLVHQGDSELTVYPSLRKSEGPWTVLLDSLAKLYVRGAAIDWKGVGADRRSRRVDLPLHPFQRRSLWVDLGTGFRSARRGDEHPLLGSGIPTPGATHVFEQTLTTEAPRFIGDHVVIGRALLPGTAILEMALAAAAKRMEGAWDVVDADFIEPIDLTAGPQRVQLRLTRREDGGADVEVHSAPAPVDPTDPWSLHARASLAVRASDSLGSIDLDQVARRCGEPMGGTAFYRDLSERRYAFGPRLRGVCEVRSGERESLGRIQLPNEALADGGAYRLHPLMTDAALQIVAAGLGAEGAGRAYLPFAVEALRVTDAGLGATEARVHSRITGVGAGTVTADVVLADEKGTVLARLDAAAFKEFSGAAPSAAAVPDLYAVGWTPVAAPDPERPSFSKDALAKVVRTLDRTMGREAGGGFAGRYDDLIEALERRSAHFVVEAFDAMGWIPRPGDEVDVEDLARRWAVVPTRRRLLHRCLHILAEEGFLERADSGFVVRRVPEGHPAEVPEAFAAAPEAVLLERCGPHLADGLRGRGDPLELLFPGGDTSFAEEMYYDAGMARILNGAVADAIQAAYEEAPADRPFRILEVGAGTAGTTRRIVERLFASSAPLGGAPIEYTFTDISPLFLDRARRRFADLAGFEYRTFDLDRDPVAQGLPKGRYDVVVGANCLHAARDVRRALRGVRTLLRPGGVLLAPELLAPHRWCDLTVGLTDGWWHFTDEDLRPSYACMTPKQWGEALGAAGLAAVEVRAVSQVSTASGHASRGQGVVVATTASADRAPWLVVGDLADLGADLAAELRSGGCVVEHLDVELRAGPETTREALVAKLGTRTAWEGIVLFGFPDAHCSAALEVPQVLDALTALVEVLRLTALADDAAAGRVRMVTRGAHAVDGFDRDLRPAAAALYGLLRSARLERHRADIRCLDLDPVPSREDAARIAAWATTEGAEPELAIRRGTHYGRRLLPTNHTAALAPSLPERYELVASAAGTLDELRLVEGPERSPGPGQVEVAVTASALNFKDVLNVLGLYPGDPGPFGTECAGVVVGVGEGVDLAVGTRVVAWVGGSYSERVVVDRDLVAPVPHGLTLAEAATLPVAYVTAQYGLGRLAGMQSGDTVLIHSAAGGLGWAACQLAQRAGARVIATAGTEEKRAWLRGRGVEHVFDSRSPSFAEGVLRATDGAGVDVVLNSLSGELIDRSFDVLSTGGRFVEVGKRGIWDPARVAALGRDIAYHVVDVGTLLMQRREEFLSVFREVMDLAGRGEIPPLPVETFRIDEAREAFRRMAAGHHVGKIVLLHSQPRPDPLPSPTADGAYVITGGTTGLGLLTAEWLVRRGARHLVLVSRSGPPASEAARVAGLRAAGAEVDVRLADVGDFGSLRDALADLGGERCAIRGVVHAAGTLSDRTLDKIERQDFETVFGAKVAGTRNLELLTRSPRRDFFVAFSSVASTLGSAGQSNHAAANAFMDAFCANLSSLGQHGMSLAWGPWSETGAAASGKVLERTRAMGIGAFSNAAGVERIEAAFGLGLPLLAGLRLDDAARLAALGHEALLSALQAKAHARRAAVATPESVSERPAASLGTRLAEAPEGARRSLLQTHLRERVRRVLGLPAHAAVEALRPLGELGLDSLLAVELRNALGEDVGRRLPASLLFDHPTLDALTNFILPLVAPEPDATGNGRTRADESRDDLASLEAMSDEDVDRLLAQRLEQHGDAHGI